jgi:hypothetical protein
MSYKKKITSTELARNLRGILDSLPRFGGSIAITRNKQHIATLVPGPVKMNALEALADLYRTLPESAAVGWVNSSVNAHTAGNLILSNHIKDPWSE